MIRLNAAYEVPSDPDRKYIYDIGATVDSTDDNLGGTKYEYPSEDKGVPTRYAVVLVVLVRLLGSIFHSSVIFFARVHMQLYKKLVIVSIITPVWVAYFAISIYQAQLGTHYWLTLEVEHFYTTITSEGSDVPSFTTELHVVGIDNQSRTHDLRTEIYNGEQGINLQNEVYQSQIGKKESYFCMTYHLVQEDCSTNSMSDSDRLKLAEHFSNSTRN
jgi:hypothetical protein